jgi:hypothetical protein
MNSVDVCRLNKYDNPDLVYGRHDGTIIKRLFSAFSFRPTVVATLPVASLFAYNPYSQNLRPTVTSIPMINVRLSVFNKSASDAAAAAAARVAAAAAGAAAGAAGAAPVPASVNQLKDALAQTNQFLEGNAVVSRHTSVMFSREVLVYYIDRRSYVYATGASLTNLARLPTSIAGFERINELPIDFQSQIEITTDDKFNFASAVVADVNTTVNPDGGNFVVGSSAVINVGGEMFHYTPSTCISRNSMDPIVRLIEVNTATKAGWRELLQKRAVILVYVNPDYKDKVLNF